MQALLAADGSRLHGTRVVISAGGTREPLDAVRYLGNRSSGRMGVALAEEARRRGAEVTLLAANLAVPAPAGVELVETPTAADLEREALARADADVVVMAAAVADYRPAERIEGKRAKDGNPWNVELEPTADVLKTLGERRRNGQVLVGFAAEAGEEGRERARAKLAGKKPTSSSSTTSAARTSASTLPTTRSRSSGLPASGTSGSAPSRRSRRRCWTRLSRSWGAR